MAVDTLMNGVRVITHGTDLTNQASDPQGWTVAGAGATPGADFVALSLSGGVTAQKGDGSLNEQWGTSAPYTVGATYEIVYEPSATIAPGDTIMSGHWGEVKAGNSGYVSMFGLALYVGLGRIRMAVEVEDKRVRTSDESNADVRLFTVNESGLKNSLTSIVYNHVAGLAGRVVVGSVVNGSRPADSSQIAVSTVQTQRGGDGVPTAAKVIFRVVGFDGDGASGGVSYAASNPASYTYQAGSSVTVTATPRNSAGTAGTPITHTLQAAGLVAEAALGVALQAAAAQIPGASVRVVSAWGSQVLLPTGGYAWAYALQLDLPCTASADTWTVTVSAVQNFSGQFYLHDAFGRTWPSNPGRIVDEAYNPVGSYAASVTQGNYTPTQKTIYTVTVTVNTPGDYYARVGGPRIIFSEVQVGDLASSNRVMLAGVTAALAGVFTVTEQPIGPTSTRFTLTSVESRDVTLTPLDMTLRATTRNAIAKLYGLRVTGRLRSRPSPFGNSEPYDFFLPPWPVSTIPGAPGVPPLPAEVWLALAFENGFRDLSTYAHTPFVQTQITNQSSGSRTGDGYAVTTGAAAAINYAADLNDLNGLTAITVEFDVWFPEAVGGSGYFFGAAGSDCWVWVGSAGTVQITPAGVWFSNATAVTLSTGTWHHVAWSGDATEAKSFLDGAAHATGVGIAPLDFASTVAAGYNFGIVNVAERNDLATLPGLRMDNVIITKLRKYTANFTPPADGVVGGNGDGVSIPSNVLFAVSANNSYLHDQSQYGLAPQKIGATVTVPTSGSRTSDGYISNTNGNSGVNARIVYSTTDAWRTAWATATSMTFEYDVYNNQLDYAGGQFMNIEYGHDAQTWPGGSGVWTLLPGVLYMGGGPAATLNHDTWYHIAQVADGVTRELRIYVNGVLTATSTGISTGGFNWESYPYSANNIGLLQLYSMSDNGSLNGGLDNIVLTAAAKYTTNFTPPTNFAEAVAGTAIPSGADVEGAGYNDVEELLSSGTGNTQATAPDTYGTSNVALDDTEAVYTAYVDAADITGTGTTTLAAATNSGAGVAAIPTNITADYTLDDFTSVADGVADVPLEFTADYTLGDFASIAVGLFLAPIDGSGDGTLEDLTVTSFAADIVTPPAAQAAFSLPMLKAAASGSPAQFDGALVTLPEFTLTARGGHNSSFSLPRITAEATGTTIAMARAIMTLPMVTLEATGRVAGQSSVQAQLPRIEVSSFGGHRAEITLPEITASASVTVGTAAQAEFSLPRITATAHGYRDDTARADITLPMLVMTPSAVTEITLPAFTVLAHGQPVLTNAYEAYVLNMNQPLDDNPRNNFEAKVEQVTRYTNWPFIQVVRLGNAYYGVAEDGLYELGGTTDNGTEIDWDFETCKTDFDDPHKKAVASAYIGGQAGATVDYTLRSGDDVDRMYEYATTKVIQKRNHRQKFGLGRRVRYYSFGLAGSGKAAIDMLEFELLNTTRRI